MTTTNGALSRHSLLLTGGLALLVLDAACTGEVNGQQSLPAGAVSPVGAAGSATIGGSSGSSPDVTAASCNGGATDPGRSPLRRLNHAEYDATVHDLLAAEPQSQNFPPDEQGAGFSNNADALNVSSLLA
ncbi:MAG TPA: DUF1587 domain-containing protein, partial [Polyangiaceae bacterium]